MSEADANDNSRSIEIISFYLGGQFFCVDIMAVREIRSWVPTTMLPYSPAYVLGVINLRGSIIPVIDLAIRLGLAPTEPTERSAIIISQVSGKLVGLLAESVSDMMTVKESQLQPPPDVLPEAERALTKAIIPIENQMLCCLDLDMLFPSSGHVAA